ncbi:MAG TPA: M15 family metallopeptidase [Xanthomonadaceae bacterium]|jgi:D-alanyl-D-alanine carboxypeptidase|nr:M15 family metallopeptidase [Xanthomonadaceae bacterium]
MRICGQRLLNTERIEAIPAWLARARGNATARHLAHADWLLRRKSDGRFLAVVAGETVHSLDPSTLCAGAGIDESLDAIACGTGVEVALDEGALPYASLGIPADYGSAHQLASVPEPAELAYAGRDRYRRPLWLLAPAARAWKRMRESALSEGVRLDAISGYRGHAYQLGIFERKLRRGLTVEQILTVNAAPGYSEHHSGRALDIGTPGEPPAEESFEHTSAFAWLIRCAGNFGFAMSYPRDNPHGITYEPWHFCHQGD